MKKLLVSIGATLLAGAGAAQTDSSFTANDSVQYPVDTTAYQPDSTQGIAFTRQQIDDLEYATQAASRAREERAAARAATAAEPTETASNSTRSSVKRTHGGAKLSLDRATDPKGRKHWGRMNRRSTRRSPDSPPGTVPAH